MTYRLSMGTVGVRHLCGDDGRGRRLLASKLPEGGWHCYPGGLSEFQAMAAIPDLDLSGREVSEEEASMILFSS